MKIAILGAGNVGGALAKLWSSQGHDMCAREKRSRGTSSRASKAAGRLKAEEAQPSQRMPEWKRIGLLRLAMAR